MPAGRSRKAPDYIDAPAAGKPEPPRRKGGAAGQHCGREGYNTAMAELPDPLESTATPRQVLSVSALNRRARQLLETHLPLLWVEGELTNFSCPASGHWYFTLKDEHAQVRAAMFRTRNRLLNLRPVSGQQVLVRGRIGLYEPRGDYQLIVDHMEPAGQGLLHRRFL